MGELQQPRNKTDPPVRQTANNFKSFANRNKSIIRNNLGMCKGSEFTLIKNFKNTVMDLTV